MAQLAANCAGNEALYLAVSSELALATARFGDVDASGPVAVTDVVLTVDLVKEVGGALLEYQAYIRKEVPAPQNDSANVSDIVMHVDALKLVAYPLSISA